MSARIVLVATSNAGKLRDFSGAAAPHGINIANIPNFSSLTPVVEDGESFEENARKKAESYSLVAPGELVLADDSGLEIDALGGAPGVHSARYAAPDLHNVEPRAAENNTADEANNARVLRELRGVPGPRRTARFVCVLAVACDGQIARSFRGTAEGMILEAPRGQQGFGYDPLFYYEPFGGTFGEADAAAKMRVSHRAQALEKMFTFLRSASI